MQRKQVALETAQPTLVEKIYQLRENELVYSELKKRQTQGFLKKLLLGTADPEKIRAAVRRRKATELKKIQTLLQNLEGSLFTIDTQAHTISQELSELIAKEFPGLQVQLVLLGSHVVGGAVVRRTLAINSNHIADLDYGVLVKGLKDPKIGKIPPDTYLEQKEQLNLITDYITAYLEKNGYDLCRSVNPTLLFAPIIASPQSAEQMLYNYFYDRVQADGLMYFYPTYPESEWKKNFELIKTALQHICKENPRAYSIITTNIQTTFINQITLKDSHFSGEASKDINSEQRKLAEVVAQLVTTLLRDVRGRQLLNTEKPNYILR